jgi:hypothetical protein
MKIHMISDTHFGIYQNNLDKWLNMMEDTFYKRSIFKRKRVIYLYTLEFI